MRGARGKRAKESTRTYMMTCYAVAVQRAVHFGCGGSWGPGSQEERSGSLGQPSIAAHVTAELCITAQSSVVACSAMGSSKQGHLAETKHRNVA
jgi:hypothetical protein